MLSKEQIDFYRENGYLVLKNCLDSHTLCELIDVTNQFIADSRYVFENNEVYDLEPGHGPNEPRVRRIKAPIQQHNTYRECMNHPRILDAVEDLVGKGVRCNGDKLNMKSGKFGSAISWHQDFAFYPHSNDDLLAVSVPIDPMTRQNGCLMVIPGTHRAKIYDHHKDGRFVGAITENIATDHVVEVEIDPGDICLHHARVIHGSRANLTPDSRRLLIFQYAANDAWPLMGIDSWEDFNRQILRGEATLEPRLEPVPVRIPHTVSLNETIYTLQEEAKETWSDLEVIS